MNDVRMAQRLGPLSDLTKGLAKVKHPFSTAAFCLLSFEAVPRFIQIRKQSLRIRHCPLLSNLVAVVVYELVIVVVVCDLMKVAVRRLLVINVQEVLDTGENL